MLHDQVARLGIADHVRFFRPMPPEKLVRVFRAADVVAVPIHNESFGLWRRWRRGRVVRRWWPPR